MCSTSNSQSGLSSSSLDRHFSYSPPNDIVFYGQLYSRHYANESDTQFLGMTFLKVVVLNADEEDEGEPEEKGPSYVLFNEIIYQKINLDPALIEDATLRVIAESAIMKQTAPSIQPRHQVGESFQTRIDSLDLPALPPPQKRRQNIHDGVLPFGFDLPGHLQPERFIAPERNNTHPPCEHPPGMCACMGRRWKWPDAHREHLLYLLETAMNFLNRILKRRDFVAITEALHRRFRGTSLPCPDRGYNTIHSYVTKPDSPGRLPYEQLVARMFPHIQRPLHAPPVRRSELSNANQPGPATKQQPQKRKRVQVEKTGIVDFMAQLPSKKSRQDGSGDGYNGDAGFDMGQSAGYTSQSTLTGGNHPNELG